MSVLSEPYQTNDEAAGISRNHLKGYCRQKHNLLYRSDFNKLVKFLRVSMFKSPPKSSTTFWYQLGMDYEMQ